ncbi:MAG: hypothetical protein IH946_05970 [Bacteroidetes bacterium]|nr:hypothetical protein [Bacteroidota bacterium]
MNFLSHFYIDHDNEDPYFTTGAILPDLAKIYNNTWRLKDPLEEFDHDNLLQIHKGVNRHYAIDAKFHNTGFFKENSDLILNRLKSEQFEGIEKYKYFLAHILLELLMDRLLVIENKAIGDKFYSLLKDTDQKFLSMYLKNFTFVYESGEFLSFFNRFIISEYLNDYAIIDKFLFALNRTWSRANKTEFTISDSKKLLQIINDLEKELSTKYLDFLDVFRQYHHQHV